MADLELMRANAAKLELDGLIWSYEEAGPKLLRPKDQLLVPCKEHSGAQVRLALLPASGVYEMLYFVVWTADDVRQAILGAWELSVSRTKFEFGVAWSHHEALQRPEPLPFCCVFPEGPNLRALRDQHLLSEATGAEPFTLFVWPAAQ